MGFPARSFTRISTVTPVAIGLRTAGGGTAGVDWGPATTIHTKKLNM
jgi:hypothetical protein